MFIIKVYRIRIKQHVEKQEKNNYIRVPKYILTNKMKETLQPSELELFCFSRIMPSLKY